MPSTMRRPGALTSSSGMARSSSTSGTPATERKASWAPSGTRNPVSLRLNKVLATNFDNEDTREALRTLSELYATSSGAGSSSSGGGGSTMSAGTTKTVVQTETRQQDGVVDEDVSLPAQPALAEARAYGQQQPMLAEAIPGESAARARKNLRRDMEQQLAEGSRKFLEALGEVDAVRRVELESLPLVS